MENILTDTKQLEKDNNMLKTELENRIEDLAKQSKAGGDNKVTYLQILAVFLQFLLYKHYIIESNLL